MSLYDTAQDLKPPFLAHVAIYGLGAAYIVFHLAKAANGRLNGWR